MNPRKLMENLRPWQAVLGFTVVLLLATLLINDGDTEAFVDIGTCYSQCDPDARCRTLLEDDNADAEEDKDEELEDDAEGYDGQFAYFIARDLDGAAPCIDVPSYRYQRILLPFLGSILSSGNDDLIPIAFVLINLTALVVSTALLETLIVDLGRSRWFALVYGLYFGAVYSVTLSTTEPLAYGLALGAVWMVAKHDRVLPAAILMALAGFTKETTGLFVAGFMLYYLLDRRLINAVVMAAIVGIPFALWQIYLYDWLGEFGVGSGGAGGTSFEIIPYNGVWRIAIDGSIPAFLVLGALFIPSAVIPSMWGLWATVKEFRSGEYHLYTCLFFSMVVIMPFVPFSTYREFLGIFRFIVGMVFMHVLYAGLRYPGRPLTYSTLWMVLLLFILFLPA